MSYNMTIYLCVLTLFIFSSLILEEELHALAVEITGGTVDDVCTHVDVIEKRCVKAQVFFTNGEQYNILNRLLSESNLECVYSFPKAIQWLFFGLFFGGLFGFFIRGK